MLLNVWENPEFTRHRRASLRPGKIGATVVVIFIACYLMGLSIHANLISDRTVSEMFWKDFYDDYFAWLLSIQAIVLVLWVASACYSSIAAERDKKTFDFLRTTSLTPAELMIGKLFGTPVGAWFAFLCITPISFVVGMLAMHNPLKILCAYLLIMVFACLVGLATMTMSLQMERTSTGSIVGVVVLFYFFAAALSGLISQLPFPGTVTMALAPPLMSLIGKPDAMEVKMTLFGTEFHPVIVALLLYVSMGAWFVLAIVRNMKRDLDEIRLFTRWQGLMLIFYFNLMFYALFDPTHKTRFGLSYTWGPLDLANGALTLNILLIGVVGLTMMSPASHYKVWWREWKAGRAAYVTESGPVLPWLIAASLPGIVCFGAYALGTSALGPMTNWPFQHTAYILIVFLVFQVRDIMFLQLCLLTKMKRPVVAGMFFLLLYYCSTCIMAVSVAVKDQEISRSVFELLTPFGCLSEKSHLLSPFAIIGVAIQLVLCGLLIMATDQRLSRKAFTPGTVAQSA